MASGVVISPKQNINKTRNAILRMKKCSPELRSVLRQRCHERILKDRSNVLNSFRKIKIQDSFRMAFGNILKEEWKNLEQNGLDKSPSKNPSTEFNLEDELLLEEILEKELLVEHENWLLQLYEEMEELLRLDYENIYKVACPLCNNGFLEEVDTCNCKIIFCTKCQGNFVIQKSLLDLQAIIDKYVMQHDNHCDFSASFTNIPKNDRENNLCIVCFHCSHLNIIE